MKAKKKILFGLLVLFFIIILKNNNVFAANEIPKIYFEGNITNMADKSDERKISVKYTSKDINFNTYAKIKIQGTSSIYYEKKNYNITLYEDSKYEKKQKVDVGQGWGSHSKYCLKANWIDKTHSRNIVSARITAKIQEKYGLFKDSPNYGLIDGFPVEIYSNGEFLGLYTWNIPKSDWMWGLDEENPNNLVFEGGDWTAPVRFEEEIKDLEESGWEIEVGEENKENIEKFNRVINFIKDSSDSDFVKNFDSYLNKDAALNYIVMVYMMQASDNLGKNLMMVTFDGKVWYPSLYDMDCTWGTFLEGSLSENYDALPEDSGNKLINRVIENFREELTDRWFELRKDILKKENIEEEFVKFIDSIPQESYDKEMKRWVQIPGYDINQIKEFIDYRLNYIDNIMGKNVEVLEKEEESEDTQNSELKRLVIYSFVIVFVYIIIEIKNQKCRKYRKIKTEERF